MLDQTPPHCDDGLCERVSDNFEVGNGTEEERRVGDMAKAGEIAAVRRRDWEDPMTVEWNKRHAHVPLHCHTNIEGEASLGMFSGIVFLGVERSSEFPGFEIRAGALKFWQQRSQADFRAAEQAAWGDDAVEAALQSADSWTHGLQFVRSLAGLWKFHLASCPEQVPEQFFSLGFDDGRWGSLPGVKVLHEVFQGVESSVSYKPSFGEFKSHFFNCWSCDQFHQTGRCITTTGLSTPTSCIRFP